MNENELIELLNNLDDDLADQQTDKLLEGVEVDLDSINKKANGKLNKINEKRVVRKKLPYVVAACICLLSVTTIYADDISKVIKSFFNTTPIYSTIVDGDAYYLKDKRVLSKDMTIENMMVSKGKLEMEITSKTKFSDEDFQDIKIIPKNDPDTVYCPGGYSEDGGNKYSFSFMNQTENNYNIAPFKDFKLEIKGQSFEVSLDKGEKLNAGSEIITADATAESIKGVNVGAKILDGKDKLKIQLITSFEDKDLKLVAFGKPSQKKITEMIENKGKEGIFASSSNSKTNNLNIFDPKGNLYELVIPKDSIGRPVTIFETDAPKDKSLILKVPSIITIYEKTMTAFKLDIPKEGTETLDKVLDLKIQKAVIEKVTRVSPTSAVIELKLNTGGDKNIGIRSFDFYSPDVKKITSEFEGDKGTIHLEFNKDLKTTNVDISYPCFVMNGNWEIEVKSNSI